jgi:hypothetical protein
MFRHGNGRRNHLLQAGASQAPMKAGLLKLDTRPLAAGGSDKTCLLSLAILNISLPV